MQVAIGNAIPTVPTGVVLTPASPKTNNDLTAVASGGTDADGTTPTYTYEWAKSKDGGTTWGSWVNAGSTLAKSLTTVGEQWKSHARSFDGTDYSAWVESAGVTVVNTVPTTPATIVLSPSSPKTDDNLVATASGSTDPDGKTPAYRYQWSRMAAGGSTWEPWGYPKAILNRTETSRSEKWRSRACSYDGTAYSDWKTSVVVMIGNTAPTVPTTVAVTPPSPKTNDDLIATASGSTDADGTTVTYGYRWARMAAGGTT